MPVLLGLQRQFPQERARHPDPVQDRRQPPAEALVTLAGAVFIAPFFLLSGLGGEIADRYDKALVARRLKLAEIGAAGLAVAGFLLALAAASCSSRSSLFGVVAALFGPIKYGILPDHLAREELPAGNALVEAATFLAILLGTIAGGYRGRGEAATRPSFGGAGHGLRGALLGSRAS